MKIGVSIGQFQFQEWRSVI